MPTIQEYMKQFDAQIDGGSTNTPAINLKKMPVLAAPVAPAKDVGGFGAAAKRAVGAGIQGVGQLGADFVPGVGQNNALQQYGKDVVDANAPAITSLGDIADRPGMALKEASGNVAGSVGTAVGLRALGQGITMASPFAGPAAPVVAAVGQGISWGSPILAGMLPSFGGIRERQIEKDPTAVDSVGSKVAALTGGAAVGMLEKYGPEGWATAALDKNARKALVARFTAPTTLGRMGMAGGKGALVEGATEMVQNPIEQMASGDNPLAAASIKDTLFAGAMGAIGGGTVGSLFGVVRDKQANTVSNDDLKGGIDEQLAPPAPAEDPTMQGEWDAMQREFAVTNAAPNQVPTPFAGQAQANDDLIRRQMDADSRDPLELTGDAPQADPLAAVSSPELTRMLGLVEQGIVSGQPIQGAENVMQRIRDVLATREEAPGADTRTLPMFDEAGNIVAPEPTLQADWDRAQAAQTGQLARTARELQVLDEQQARAASVAPTARAATLAADREMARIENRPITPVEGRDLFGATETVETPPARMTKQDAALTQQLNQLEQRAVEGVATPQEMSQMQQLRDRLAPPAASASAGQDARTLLAPISKRELRGQERAKLETAPVEDLPNRLHALWEKKGGFGGPAYAESLGKLYTQLTGAQIQDHAGMVAAQTSAELQGFQESPTQGRIENVQGVLKAIPRLSPEQQRQNMDATEDRQQVVDALGENIPAPVVANETPVDAAQAALPLTDATQTQETKNAPTPTPAVAELGGKGSRGNTGAGVRAGGDRTVSAPGAVRGRAGTPAASDVRPVAVGSATGERAAAVADAASPFAKPEKRDLELAEYKDAYLNLRKPADMPLSTFKKKKIAYLQSIAEMERNADASNSKKAATKFLEEQARFDPAEVKAARRKAADAVKLVEDVETKLSERNKLIAEKQEAWDQLLSEMDDTQKRKASHTDKQLEKAFAGKASGAVAGKANPNAHTLRSLAEELVKHFGVDMQAAILAGRVKLVVDQTHLAAETGDMSRRGQFTQGMYYWNRSKPAGNGTVYFVAENLARAAPEHQGYTAFDVALHEIGEHAGMEQMLGKQDYQQLLGSIKRAMAGENPKSSFTQDVAAAMKKLLPDQREQPFEVLAYMIQYAPDSTGLQKMWVAIKAFAARFGLLPDSMKDAATMRTLAAGAASKWLSGVATTSKRDDTNRRGTIKRVEAERAAMLRKLKQEHMLTEATVAAVEELLYKGKGNLVGAKMELASLTGAKRDYDTVLAQSKAELSAGVETKMLAMRETRLAEAKAKLAGIEQKIDAINAKYDAQLPAKPTTGAASGIANPETRKIFTNFADATTAAKNALSSVEALKEQDWLGKTTSAFTSGISWLTKHHLTALFDKSLNSGLSLNVKADTIQEATSARLNQMFNEPYHQFEALERAAPERAKMLGQLMQATEFRLDPRKGWEAHTHLHSLAGDELALAKKYLNEYRQMWGKLVAEETKLYNDLSTMNEAMYTAELAVVTYNMVRANPGAQQIAEFKADPTEKFRQSTAVHGSIEDAHTYWKGVLDTYVAAIDKHVAEQRGTLPKRGETDPTYQAEVNRLLKDVRDEKARNRIRAQLRTHGEKLSDGDRKIVRHLTPLEAQLRTVSDTVETFKHAPYFHLGRFGDDFVSFRVRNDGVTADPAAMAHVQQVLADKFPKITIRTDATDPHVFARFENVTEAHNFEKELFKLQEQGWLMQEGVKDQGNKDLGKIVRGTRATIIEQHAGPQWLEMVVESIQAEGYEPDVEAQMVAHVRSLYIDSLPDTAAIKVKLRREGRPGWHSDMLRNYAHRMRVGSNRVAALAAEPTRTESFAVMKDALAQAGEDKTIDRADLKKRHAVAEEFKKRHLDQLTVPQTPGIDMLRAVNHAYFLGMSPSYVLIQMTQLGVLTWPELAKKHGFVKSVKAIAEVTGIAVRIMKAVIAEGYKSRGVKGSADMVITGEMLETAGVSASDAEFLISIMASGKLDIGNSSRELGRVAEGAAEGKWGRRGTEALRVASAFGYASETLTRTITALAAKRLHKGPGAVEYAIGVIDESMLNYASNNIGRMTGKQGVVSTWTPVMFSFLQYQFQLLEKLYREFYTAFAAGATAEQQAEARRFLGGHMMSMMALAGSLGLPFATAIAAAADKLCEMFGDGHCDSKVALRNMTSDVFGHDIEPLISRGLFRATGADVSDRAGEANILPFSKFLADKRAMDDSLKDLAVASWGAPSAMVASMFKGYGKIAQGDLLGGLQEAMPLALKGPIKAFEMSEKGYTDKAGNVLPMNAGAYDMMLQTLGLNPGEKADYQQAKFAQSQRTGILGREATQIRQKLASAIEQGDKGAVEKWSERAQEFDTTNPAHAILPRMSSVMQQRARSRAQAEATSTTLGVSLKDLEAQQLTRFMQL